MPMPHQRIMRHAAGHPRAGRSGTARPGAVAMPGAMRGAMRGPGPRHAGPAPAGGGAGRRGRDIRGAEA
jgi:hypothetical protein